MNQVSLKVSIRPLYQPQRSENTETPQCHLPKSTLSTSSRLSAHPNQLHADPGSTSLLVTETSKQTSKPRTDQRPAGSGFTGVYGAGATKSSQNIEQHRPPQEQPRLPPEVLEEFDRLRRERSLLLDQLQTQRGQLHSLLSHLDKVQRVTSTADTCSDMDIVQDFKVLNEEVFQTASTLVDELADHSNGTEEKEDLTEVHSSVFESVGQDMLHRLATVNGADKLSWLEFAFQAYLAHQLCRIVSSWIDNQPVNDMIENMYRQLREAGEIPEYY